MVLTLPAVEHGNVPVNKCLIGDAILSWAFMQLSGRLNLILFPDQNNFPIPLHTML